MHDYNGMPSQIHDNVIPSKYGFEWNGSVGSLSCVRRGEEERFMPRVEV